MLQACQRLVGVQAEHVLVRRIDGSQHPDVSAGTEELLASASQHDGLHTRIEARLDDGLVQVAHHLVRIAVGRRIDQRDHRHSTAHLVGGFAVRQRERSVHGRPRYRSEPPHARATLLALGNGLHFATRRHAP